MRRFLVGLLLAAVLMGTNQHRNTYAIGGDSTDVAPTAVSFCDGGGCHLKIYKFDASARGFIWTLHWDSATGWQPWVQDPLPFNLAGNISESYYRWAIDSVANAQCYGPGTGWHSATSTSVYDLDAKRATPSTDTRGGNFVTAAILSSPNYGNTELLYGPTSYNCTPVGLSLGNIGGLTNWSPAVEWLSDGYHVFVTGVDATTFQWSPIGGWTNFLGGGSAGSPSVVSWDHDLRTDVFVRGLDNHMYHRWYDPTIDPATGQTRGWYPYWEDQMGLLDSGPGCTSRQAFHLDCFVIGSAGHVYQKWWEPASGWNGWYDLG